MPQPLRNSLFVIILILSTFTVSGTCSAQLWNSTPDLIVDGDGVIGHMRAGFGWTRIASSDTGRAVNYATVTLYPELAVGKLRAGLAIDLLVNTKNDPGGSQIRMADLKAGHLFRYVRYGSTSDPWYVHAGALERVSLGNGFIVSRYSNQFTDQSRRVGVWFKIDGGGGGIEGMVSNIGTREIYGARAFIRPFEGILRRLTVGVTLAIDDDPSRGRTRLPASSAEIIGADVSYPLIDNQIFSVTGYGDIAKFLDSGSGGAVGLRTDVPEFLGLITLTARLEQYFMERGFIPSFFDETYEVTSILANGEARFTQLQALGATSGTHGALEGLVLGRIKLMASYRTFYERPDNGVFHGEAHLLQTIPRVTVRAVYDKQGVGGLSDLKRLDNRSVALAEATYRIYPFLLVGFDYRWTFAFDEAPNVRTFRPQERFSPKIMFDLKF